jgi:endonuclease YncB( thermonuclease family)
MHLYKRVFATLMALVIMLTGFGPANASVQSATPGEDLAPEYFGAVPWELPDDAEKMVVDSVVDGDTVKLTEPNDDWWESYRIVGIQAPEMDGPYTDEECYGPEAKEFLIDLLPKGTEVYIQQDISNKDRNGRFLRHIFIVDEETEDVYLLSEVLVLGGFAKAREYPPDDLYADVLEEAQEIADEQDAGLWDECAA